MLNIPASTLRRYASDFEAHLSDQAKASGRSRRYSEADIVYLERARKLLQMGHSPEEVNKLLYVVEDDELQGAQDTALAKIPGISTAIEEINNRAAAIMFEIENLSSRQEQTESTQSDILKRLEQLEQQASKSWLNKLLGRK